MSRSMTVEGLTRELAARGVPLKGVEPTSPVESDRPWFISAVLGVSGWLAGFFTLGFVALLLGNPDPSAFGIIGVFMLGAAFALYAYGRGVFLDQFALALSIAGQLSLLFAVGDGTDSAVVTSAFMTVLEVALLVAMRNPLAKSLAAFFAIVAWALTVRLALWEDSLFEDHPRSIALAPALGAWFAIWLPLIAVTQWLVVSEARWMSGRWRLIARPALGGLLAALALATWASEPFGSLPTFAETSEPPHDFLVLWPLLATGTAMFAAVSAYRLRDRPLVGVAVAGALLHVSQFYYGLGVSLLAKSVLLGFVGGALLFFANLLVRRDGEGARGAP